MSWARAAATTTTIPLRSDRYAVDKYSRGDSHENPEPYLDGQPHIFTRSDSTTSSHRRILGEFPTTSRPAARHIGAAGAYESRRPSRTAFASARHGHSSGSTKAAPVYEFGSLRRRDCFERGKQWLQVCFGLGRGDTGLRRTVFPVPEGCRPDRGNDEQPIRSIRAHASVAQRGIVKLAPPVRVPQCRPRGPAVAASSPAHRRCHAKLANDGQRKRHQAPRGVHKTGPIAVFCPTPFAGLYKKALRSTGRDIRRYGSSAVKFLASVPVRETEHTTIGILASCAPPRLGSGRIRPDRKPCFNLSLTRIRAPRFSSGALRRSPTLIELRETALHHQRDPLSLTLQVLIVGCPGKSGAVARKLKGSQQTPRARASQGSPSQPTTARPGSRRGRRLLPPPPAPSRTYLTFHPIGPLTVERVRHSRSEKLLAGNRPALPR